MAGNVKRMAGATLLLLVVVPPIFAPWIAPHDPLDLHLAERLQGPSVTYPFGTDHLGRCVFSRVLYGARLSLGIALVVSAITAIFGTLIGLAAGYAGGWMDALLMRVVDAILAIPNLVLTLVIAGLLGPGLVSLIVALSISGWTRYARSVRGIVRAATTRTFVAATRTLGAPAMYIVLRRILPETLPTVFALSALGSGRIVLSVAALSFLGLGLQPPAPEWGSMLQSGRYYLRAAPHLIWFPGAAILITVAALQNLAERLRQDLDPQGLLFAGEALAPRR
jgi:peptide/nickel transport system permease protein